MKLIVSSAWSVATVAGAGHRAADARRCWELFATTGAQKWQEDGDF